MEEKSRLLQQTLSDAERQKKDLLAKAYREASELIADTKRQMRAFLDEIKKREKAERRRGHHTGRDKAGRGCTETQGIRNNRLWIPFP